MDQSWQRTLIARCFSCSSPCCPSAAAAVPVAWGWGLGWRDLVLATVMYLVTGHGITVGYHRYFTHGSFRANRPLKNALALAGSMAIEGPVIQWVADHRRHHAFSDREGDPHSPWRYGNTVPALIKGFSYAHVGWLFDLEQRNPRRHPGPDQGPRHPADLPRLPSVAVRCSARRPGVAVLVLVGAVTASLASLVWVSPSTT
jgi:stearoyl-CoA desaturase (delta-9 desaturase)